MIRRITICLALVSLIVVTGCNPNNPSDSQARSFIKLFGSYMYDSGRDLVVVPGEGYALTGIATAVDSVQHMVLVITDEFGNYLDTLHYLGGTEKSAGNALALLDDGYLLGGSIDSTSEAGEQTYAYLVKTDRSGSILWEKSFETEEDAAINDLVVLSDGGYLAAGYKYQDGQKDWWIFRTDEDGEIIYEHTGDLQDSDDEAVSVLETDEGFLFACTYDDVLYSGTDMVLIYTGDDCSPKNSMAFGSNSDDVASCLAKGDQNYYLLGYSLSTYTQTVLYSFTIEGDLISEAQKLATISANEIDLTGEKLVLLESGTLAIAGTSLSIENKDIFITLLDPESMEQEKLYYGVTGNQSAFDMVATPAGGMVICGSTQYEVNSMIVLMKTGADGKL